MEEHARWCQRIDFCQRWSCGQCHARFALSLFDFIALVGSGMRVELVVEGVGDTMRLRKREMKWNERLYNKDIYLRCIINDQRPYSRLNHLHKCAK